jgi:tetratricopeptide (TPR) repeat protein
MGLFSKNLTFIKLTMICWLVLTVNNISYAQLNLQKQEQIRQYTQQIKIYKAKNDLKTAAKYSNKCASIYLSAGNYQDAINSYLESAQMNELIGNDADNKKIYNNIAMIYSEMYQLNNCLKYFEKSLLISRRNNNKREIAVSLMDISTILSFNKQNDKAIEYLNEALKISSDLKDLHNLRTCYSLLSQCYKASGNIKKSNEYYENFLAYDKKIKAGDTIMDDSDNFLSAKSENKYISETENKINPESGNVIAAKAGKHFIINNMITDDTLAFIQSAKKAANLQIEVLNKDKQLNESKLKMAESKNEKDKILIYSETIAISLLIILLAIGIYLLQKKQKYIYKLEQKLSEIEKLK